jgi:hypothetical protein
MVPPGVSQGTGGFSTNVRGKEICAHSPPILVYL